MVEKFGETRLGGNASPVFCLPNEERRDGLKHEGGVLGASLAFSFFSFVPLHVPRRFARGGDGYPIYLIEQFHLIRTWFLHHFFFLVLHSLRRLAKERPDVSHRMISYAINIPSRSRTRPVSFLLHSNGLMCQRAIAFRTRTRARQSELLLCSDGKVIPRHRRCSSVHLLRYSLTLGNPAKSEKSSGPLDRKIPRLRRFDTCVSSTSARLQDHDEPLVNH